jgi:osmotically-inducible protein OsmY
MVTWVGSKKDAVLAHEHHPDEHPYQRPEPSGELTQEVRQQPDEHGSVLLQGSAEQEERDKEVAHQRRLGDYGRWVGSAAGTGKLGAQEGNVAPGENPEMKTTGDIRHSGPNYGYGPRNYRRSDERIWEDVCERLSDHGAIDAREMEVQVHDGRVRLTGTVATPEMRTLAENIAFEVNGVGAVENELQIALRAGDGRL